MGKDAGRAGYPSGAAGPTHGKAEGHCGVKDMLTFQGEGDFNVTLKHQTYGEIAAIFNRLIVSECFEMSQIYFGKKHHPSKFITLCFNNTFSLK